MRPEPPQRLYGLTVAADFALHQDRPAPPGAPVDLTVRDGEPLAGNRGTPAGELLLDFGKEPDRWYSVVRRADSSVLLRVHGVCDFVIAPDLRDVTVHLVLSSAALARRTDPALRWTLPAFARYAAEVAPASFADVVVRADDPRHPALVESSVAS